MRIRGVFSKNFYVDAQVVSDLSTDICSVMSEADDVIQEMSGAIREIIALEAGVPAKAQCGELTSACVAVLSGIRNIDFMSYGQRTKASMSELCDYSDFVNQNLVKNMQLNQKGLLEIKAGAKSLSMLMKYTRMGDDRDVMKIGVGQGVGSKDDKKDDKDRCISLEYQAAMLTGIKTNGSGLPNITNGVDAKRYQECLKKLQRGQYSNMEIAAAVAGITMNNGIVSINNESEAKRYMDVLNQLRNREAKCVGFLSYGSDGITQNAEEGFFKLYDSPTLSTKGERYFCKKIYADNGQEPYGALQSFGEDIHLNKNKKGVKFENVDFNPEKGTILYKGIERYAIALGPKLQNPEFDIKKKQQIEADEMAYGTCVDISIEMDGRVYYIPAIIVDVKAHTFPTGIIQSDESFEEEEEDENGNNNENEDNNEEENTSKLRDRSIVEWYTKQDKDGPNKSDGLNRFNRKSSIIIYRDEVLYDE